MSGSAVARATEEYLNKELKADSNDVFRFSKGVITMFWVLIIVSLLICFVPIALGWIYLGSDVFLVDNLFIYSPSIIFLPLTFLCLPSFFQLKYQVKIHEEELELYTSKESVFIPLNSITNVTHSYIKNAMIIHSGETSDVVSKYLKGTEVLYSRILEKVELQPIYDGKKSKLSSNYCFVSGLMLFLMGIPCLGLAVGFAFYGDEYLWFEKVFILLVGLIATIILGFVSPLQFYARYHFYTNHFIIKGLFREQKVKYKWIQRMHLNKTQNIINIKLERGRGELQIFTPLDLSIEDMYIYLKKESS